MWERGLEVPVVDLDPEVPVVARVAEIAVVPEVGVHQWKAEADADPVVADARA